MDLASREGVEVLFVLVSIASGLADVFVGLIGMFVTSGIAAALPVEWVAGGVVDMAVAGVAATAVNGPCPASRDCSPGCPETIRSFCMAGMLGTGGTGDPDSPIAPGVAVVNVLPRPGMVESFCCCEASLEFQLELRLRFETSAEVDRESSLVIDVGVADRFASPVMIEVRPASSIEVDVRGPLPRRLASRRSMKLGVVGRPIVIGVVFLTGGATR